MFEKCVTSYENVRCKIGTELRVRKVFQSYLTILNCVRSCVCSDSAFLSAGSSTELNVETTLPALLPPKSTPEQSSPISDLGSDTTRTRKRQSSDSSQNSDPNPASPDSSGSVNYAFNQLNVSLQDADDKETQPAKVCSIDRPRPHLNRPRPPLFRDRG